MAAPALHDRAGDGTEASPYTGGATAQLHRLAGVHGTRVFETTRQPFLVLDERLRVVTANPAFWRQFELSPDEPVRSLTRPSSDPGGRVEDPFTARGVGRRVSWECIERCSLSGWPAVR